MQTMFRVLCIYLLLGLLFGTLFGAIQSLSEESFFTNDEHSTSDFLYFSFATLTTVGYEDLVAATNLGRSLAIAEALIGQIYPGHGGRPDRVRLQPPPACAATPSLSGRRNEPAWWVVCSGAEYSVSPFREDR